VYSFPHVSWLKCRFVKYYAFYGGFSTLSEQEFQLDLTFFIVSLFLNLSQVGRTTLGGLLALGYSVVVSFKRTSRTVNRNQLLIAAETIDSLNESFLVLKGPSRKVTLGYCLFTLCLYVIATVRNRDQPVVLCHSFDFFGMLLC
jgi:hypothetical protein